MPKVYLICGKICCGKTTYAEKLCAENNAILLDDCRRRHAHVGENSHAGLFSSANRVCSILFKSRLV